MSSKGLAPNTSCVLYLGAIPYHWDVEIIKSVVCGSGPVVDVRCMMDSVAKNKGFCFIEYATPQDAQRALRLLSMIKLEGRKKLRIELSKEGLRNPTPGSKPELKLNKNFLPSGVLIPDEMMVYGSNNQDSLNLNLVNQQQQSQNPNSLSTSQGGQQPNDLIATLSMNPQLPQMVSQMISNGMDMNQITSFIQQFSNNNSLNPNSNNSNSTPPPQSSQQSSNNNFNMFDSSAANRNVHSNNLNVNNFQIPMHSNNQFNNSNQATTTTTTNNTTTTNASTTTSSNNTSSSSNPSSTNNNTSSSTSSSSIPTHLSMASSYLSNPHDLNVSILTKDKVSETLSSIPPGILIELLSKLKFILTNSNLNQIEAVNILQENPKLAVAAAQSLLLMGIIDLDVISQTMSNSNSTNSNNNTNNNSNNNANSTNSNSPAPSTMMNNTQVPPQMSLQQQQYPLRQPVMGLTPTPSPPFTQQPVDTALSTSPFSNSSSQQQQQQQQLNPNWIGLSNSTIQKLSKISEKEADLIVQVLKLSNQQIDLLPENERVMANNIRAQYL